MRRNLNKLTIKYQSYPKSTTINGFEQKICNVTVLHQRIRTKNMQCHSPVSTHSNKKYAMSQSWINAFEQNICNVTVLHQRIRTKNMQCHSPVSTHSNKKYAMSQPCINTFEQIIAMSQPYSLISRPSPG